MLKLGEKIIFSIKSGFSLNGGYDYNLDDKCLQLTNLGNIYVSKVDCLPEECSDFIMYDYSEEGINLYSELDGESINIISEELPFKLIEGNHKTEIKLSLIMILDFEEFAKIDEEIKNMIFDFRQGDIIMTADGKHIFAGELEKEDARLIFNSGRNRFELNFEDVESFSESFNRINFKGYFYMDTNSIVMRNISFVGAIEQYLLPRDFEKILSENKKIGRLPKEDPVVFCKVTGRIKEKTYLSKNMFLINHDDLFVFYEKKQKNEVICKEISNFTKYDLGNGNYIIYDGDDVYNMYINKNDAEKVGFNSMGEINEKYIGYTEGMRPFFIEIDKDLIKIGNSKENSVLNIKKEEISEINIHEEKKTVNENLINIQIRYANKKVNLNLSRKLVPELIDDVFSGYQKSLFDYVSVEESYLNWVKTVSDMVVYNLFGEIYGLSGKLPMGRPENYDTLEWVDFINDFHEEIESQKRNTDEITVYLTDILEKNELKYFKGLGKECDTSSLEKLSSLLIEMRRDLNYDLNDILKKFEMLDYLILPKNMRKSSIRLLKESQIYQIEYFGKMALKKIRHLIYAMLPYYIEKTIKSIFEIYFKIYENYEGIDEVELKTELMNRIKSAYIFKQFSISEESCVLRKDAIDDLYSLVKFSSMRIDSEFYYTGGYR